MVAKLIYKCLRIPNYSLPTFKISLPLFAQVYTILAEIHGGVHPAIYALLPNKTRSTYIRLFEFLKAREPNLNPDTVCCEFEYAAFTAMKRIFHGVTLHGCFFHLTKNMKKKLGELHLMTNYNTIPDFALKSKIITSLAFVLFKILMKRSMSYQTIYLVNISLF